MTKKIFDIVPPNQINKKPAAATNKKSSFKKKKKKLKKITTGGWWWKISLVAILFIVLGGFIYQSGWAAVDLTLSPAQMTVETEKRVTVNVSQDGVDKENIVVPGKLIKEEIEKSRQFEAQGEKKKKAHGTLTVYNSYNNPVTPINLIAQTRFLSNSGYYFLSETPVHIPAARYEEGELVPGSTQIEVVAMEGGEEYNISPAQFSIPGLSGTAYYDKIYASSEEKMIGGGVATQVTSEDLNRAHRLLSEELITDGVTKFRTDNKEYEFLKAATNNEIIKSYSSVEVGTELEHFDFTINSELTALGIKEVALQELAQSLLKDELATGTALVPESLETNYYVSSKDLEEGRMVIKLTVSGKSYQPVDKEALKTDLQGMSLGLLEGNLEENYGEFEAVKVDKKPFWLRKVPTDLERISVEIEF